MNIITFYDGSAHDAEVEVGGPFSLGEHILVIPLGRAALVIDSWNNLMDLVPQALLDPVTRACRIPHRYFSGDDHPGEGLRHIQMCCSSEERARGINVISLCPTFFCNLACTYCFERAFEIDKAVNEEGSFREMLKEAEDFAYKARDLYPDNPTVIEPFGGEPLQRNLRSFIAGVFALARKLEVGVAIVSNGFNLISFLDTFALNRDVLKSVSLTIDGPKAVHDRVRVTRNGKGSFERIVKAVDAMVELGLPVRVCTNVGAGSLDALGDLIEFVKERPWVKSPSFQMEIGRVYDRYAANRDETVYEYQIQKKLIEIFGYEKPAWLISGFMKSTEYPSRLIGVDFGQNEYGKSRFSYCWATSNIIRGYYLGPDRKRYRCTTTVGNRLFELSKGPDELPLETQEEWLAAFVDRDGKCLRCPIGGYCNGGCKVERQYRTCDEICECEKGNFRLFVEEVVLPRVRALLDRYERSAE